LKKSYYFLKTGFVQTYSACFHAQKLTNKEETVYEMVIVSTVSKSDDESIVNASF